MPRFGINAEDEKVLEVLVRSSPQPTAPDSDRARSVYAIGLVRKARAKGHLSGGLQLLHNQFAEVSNSVMIRMLLGTMQEKLVDSQVTGFELENLLVG